MNREFLEAATFSTKGSTDITIVVTMSDGKTHEFGPLPGPCEERERPSAKFTMLCADHLQVRAINDGRRLLITKLARGTEVGWEEIGVVNGGE